MEHEVVGYGIAVRELGHVTIGESTTLHCSKNKKTMYQPFGVAHTHFFSADGRRTGQ
jgi:hypothetical protein